MKSRIADHLSRLVSTFFPQPDQTEYETYPEWAGCSPAELLRLNHRLARLALAYRQKFRADGAMDVPLHCKLLNQKLLVEKRTHTASLSARQAAAQLTSPQIDVVMRAILAQLVQLEQLGYVHGAIRPDSLTIHKDGGVWTASVGRFHSGRFTDESVERENLFDSPWTSPESWQLLHHPHTSTPAGNSDVFSAASLYYTLLSGETPCTVDGKGSPAQAVSQLLPAVPGKVRGFRASFIRWMQAPAADDRPSASDALETFSLACEAGLTNPPPLPRRDGSTESRGSLTILRDEISPDHLCSQYLASDGTSLLLLREHHQLWDPARLQGSFFDLQRERRSRELNRMKTACQLSARWNAANPLICVNLFHSSSRAALTAAPLNGSETLTLGQLRALNDSVFLLDARMTEVLAAVQTLHDEGYMLGCFSAASFYAGLREDGAAVYLADVSGAAPFNDLPPPCDFSPEAGELRLLSPELTRYIGTGAKTNAFDAQLWLSTASDIFTLGLIYHLILSGEYPALAEPDYGTFSNALQHSGRPEKAFQLSPLIDRQHSRLIQQMLALDPLHRPARCEDVIQRILAFYTA